MVEEGGGGENPEGEGQTCHSPIYHFLSRLGSSLFHPQPPPVHPRLNHARLFCSRYIRNFSSPQYRRVISSQAELSSSTTKFGD
jgi:hypothetical protein